MTSKDITRAPPLHSPLVRCVLILATALGRVSEFLSKLLPAGPLRRDDSVVIFPTIARPCSDGSEWYVPIHGWVHQQERDETLRHALVTGIVKWLGLERGSPESGFLRERLSWFLVDNKRCRMVKLRVADQILALGPTDPQGHFVGEARLTVAAAAEVARDAWLELEVLSEVHASRAFVGRALLMRPTGLCVISDLDDTVKVTHVLDRRELLKNTLLRPFQAVPEMALLYRELAARGATIHFVSCSPWHLYPTLDAFLREAGFPESTIVCKRLRLKDSSLKAFLTPPDEFKIPRILELIDQFPLRRFLLVGDSGEKDPEIYGRVARQQPSQIAGVLIRSVKSDDADAQRWSEAFRDLDPSRWQLFREPRDLDLAKWI